MENALKIYIIAGEASGDLIGAHVMRSLKRQHKEPIRFYGVGGPRMAAEGLKSLFPYDELSLLGFVEVLPYALKIFARVNTTVDDIVAKEPDAVITIDVPGFSFRVIEKLRKEGLESERMPKCIHYVAPTVWAYKPQRAKRFAWLYDHILVLLPFEAPYFEKEGLPATWVGHPVVAETNVTADGAAFRARYDLPAETPLFCLLPGSRKGEIRRHMPIFNQAIAMLGTEYPNLAIAAAVPKDRLELMAEFFKGCPFRTIVVSSDEDKKGAIAASNVAIVKSGTVALEVAMLGTPMLITYRVNPISAWSLKRIILTKYANLLNILEEREIIPELLQELCTPLMLASAAAHLFAHPACQQIQKESVKTALKKLVPESNELPSDKAARKILEILS